MEGPIGDDSYELRVMSTFWTLCLQKTRMRIPYSLDLPTTIAVYSPFLIQLNTRGGQRQAHLWTGGEFQAGIVEFLFRLRARYKTRGADSGDRARAQGKPSPSVSRLPIQHARHSRYGELRAHSVPMRLQDNKGAREDAAESCACTVSIRVSKTTRGRTQRSRMSPRI
ncbi:hypothetical protein NDU88_000953 [Pleurodeles waltl]|uniref:Uncharacterized protein n=1 Tax=Pleurodeles waltl TaxID=8319 RepID=A0AAV7WM60_PLEWA|nr:hypothetical protein NDU88_000953 [Pleurodeles waltl]